MNIAYITADRGVPVFGDKGASVHVREMVGAFAALGHTVTVFAARGGIQTSPIEARIVEVGNELAYVASSGQPAGDNAKRRVKEQRSMAISDRIEEHLVRLHREQGFDLIYERYSLFSTGGIRAAQRIGVPCLVEVNSPLLEEQQMFRELCHEAEAKAVESEVFNRAHALLTVSAEVHAYALAKGARPDRSYVVPNGVDTTRFKPGIEAEPIEGATGKFVIGFAGSLKPWHGIEVLMDSYRVLARERDDYHLLIVGDGPLYDWIGGYANGADLVDRVTMTGWIPYERLPGLIRAMDVAVAPYPAIEKFYFSPLKLYEYLAVGVPVVASRIGQIADVLEDGVNGLLAVPGDADDLARRVETLRGDERLRTALGEAGVRLVAEHTWQHNAQRVIDIAGPMLGVARAVL